MLLFKQSKVVWTVSPVAFYCYWKKYIEIVYHLKHPIHLKFKAGILGWEQVLELS